MFFFIFFMIDISSFIMTRKHLLCTMLSLGIIIVSFFYMFMVLFFLLFDFYLLMYFLGLSVCEGALICLFLLLYFALMVMIFLVCLMWFNIKIYFSSFVYGSLMVFNYLLFFFICPLFMSYMAISLVSNLYFYFGTKVLSYGLIL